MLQSFSFYMTGISTEIPRNAGHQAYSFFFSQTFQMQSWWSENDNSTHTHSPKSPSPGTDYLILLLSTTLFFHFFVHAISYEIQSGHACHILVLAFALLGFLSIPTGGFFSSSLLDGLTSFPLSGFAALDAYGCALTGTDLAFGILPVGLTIFDSISKV